MIDPRQPDFTSSPVSGRRPRFGYAPGTSAGEPLVSIVTPFYDPGETFRETARSVREQSLQQWEWIVVDDASTDASSLAILAELLAVEPRLRVVRHDGNRGPGAARNSGFAAARGRYVLLLDSDDLIEPTAAEKWLWFLESHPAAGFVKGFTVGFGGESYLWSYGFHAARRFLMTNQVQTTSMVRREVHRAAGGFDETIRGGLEDWDFWLRCAAAGHWGDTVPEYLDWYRRRADHGERWASWDNGARQEEFSRALRKRYRRLFRRGFPPRPRARAAPTTPTPDEPPDRPLDPPPDELPDELPLANPLPKRKRRLLLVVPWLTTGGSDKFALDLVGELVRRDWEVTIAATRSSEQAWLAQFAALTPDVFVLPHFLRLADAPRFLRYLVQSRGVDAVLLSHSELGYRLLPYLRAHFPGLAYLDFCHIEEPEWHDGGYPTYAIRHQLELDLHVVASRHLAAWMVARGADPARVEVATTNVDVELWRPDAELRADVRRELGIDPATPLVLFAGRLVPQKQPRVLAETLRRLHRAGATFAAVVAGDGPEGKELRRALARDGLDACVRCLGDVPPQRMRGLMAAADVFFLPSKWEGISLALYEAMAAGLAVVAADVGGQRELVTPACGILVPRSDELAETAAYAAALAPLLADAAARRRLGERARARVEAEFPLAAMGDRMHALLLHAIELARDSPRAAPTLARGRAAAAEAVAHARLVEGPLFGWAATTPTGVATSPQSLRGRLYATAYRWHEPIYHWYRRRGWTWMTPIRARVKSWLGGET